MDVHKRDVKAPTKHTGSHLLACLRLFAWKMARLAGSSSIRAIPPHSFAESPAATSEAVPCIAPLFATIRFGRRSSTASLVSASPRNQSKA